MTDASVKFEKQICQIHSLLEQEGSEVTWNDKLPDPDNPNQSRQIDISIKRDGKLTLVECRIRQKPQDVMWIEELIGRRVSLRADAVIAVSNSGFTEGAIIKGKEFGIILRDMRSLTEQEIQMWGFRTHVSLTFFKYTDVKIALHIDKMEGTPNLHNILYDLKTPSTMYAFFQTVAYKFDEKRSDDRCGTLKTSATYKNLLLGGARVHQIDLETHIDIVTQDLNTPSVVGYDAPLVQAHERQALIEKIDLGEFEITQSSNKVAVIIDLSQVQCLPNHQFQYVTIDFKRSVCADFQEIIGLPKFQFSLENVKWNMVISI